MGNDVMMVDLPGMMSPWTFAMSSFVLTSIASTPSILFKLLMCSLKEP